MIIFDKVIKKNIKEHNPNWPQTPEHPQKILIIEGFESGKTNPLFNLINQPVINKFYLYAKDLYEVKYHLLINKRKITGLKYLNNSKAFIECSNGY